MSAAHIKSHTCQENYSHKWTFKRENIEILVFSVTASRDSENA